MNATQSNIRNTDLTVTPVFAQLFERLDCSKVPVGADQYRSVVRIVVSELGDVAPNTVLGALSDSRPATVQLYENVNYQHVGLCRSAPRASNPSEQQAKEVLDRAMRRAMNHSNTPHKEDPTHGKS